MFHRSSELQGCCCSSHHHSCPKASPCNLAFLPKKRLISGSSAHRAAPAGYLISELQAGRRKRAVLGNGGGGGGYAGEGWTGAVDAPCATDTQPFCCADNDMCSTWQFLAYYIRGLLGSGQQLFPTWTDAGRNPLPGFTRWEMEPSK